MVDVSIQHPDAGARDVRPSVMLPSRGLSGWILGATALVAGILLFVVLEARRQTIKEPTIAARPGDIYATSAPPPTLYIPPDIPPAPPLRFVERPFVAAPQAPAPAPAPPPPQVVYMQPTPLPALPPPAARPAAGPILVVDGGSAASAGATAATPAQAGAPTGTNDSVVNTDRARAGAFANRSTTIVQGTLIPAVLETALDSSRPGFARAIVSRDVRGFDGERVLIPRGSRMIGEYRSDAQPGQKRALVIWTRLIRPDGATIALGSPAADTLGGVGIRAKVDNHFFERFAGAIVQSALDIGVNLASRSANSAVVVALPGLQNNVQPTRPQEIAPTLTVRQGSSISVFVARDLDFTGVERRP